MKRDLILILVFTVLSACLPKVSVSFGAPTPTDSQIIPVPSQIPENSFEVEAWVDNPAPAHDARVILVGSLIKNGAYLSGIMMQATWPDKTQERGVPNCYVLVTYGRGVCVINTSSLPPGVFVPITITFEYGGGTYIGQTGFAPQ
ncbi:MAG: hypothetical protein ACYC3P_05805 [Bellilinea sp.]